MPKNDPQNHARRRRRAGRAIRASAAVCLLLAVLWLLGGCALVKLREDVQFSQDSCLLFGEVVSRTPLKTPVVVVAYSVTEGKAVVEDYAVLSAPGPYELLVREGRHRVFAFEDRNGDLKWDRGERAGHYGKPRTIVAPSGGVVWGLDIELAERTDSPAPSFAGTPLVLPDGRKKPFTSAGSVANLDDPAFSAEQGEKGFWLPLDSFRYTGANICFLEPYDPKKIPVLLVHGAAGSPQDWRPFIEKMDRSRYQPWLFHYPSGARLRTVSFFLRKKLYDLYQQYEFDQLYVVAHSMGGLVSRSALIEDDLHNKTVKLFISISSPWGGEPRARTGVEHSPAVIPSWKDMTPESEFIRSIFAAKIPDTMRYYLLFSHKGAGGFMRQNNDNTVTLESMLDPRAQADARKVIGLNEDHVSILGSAETMKHFRAITASTETNLKKTLKANRGYVEIQHRFVPADTKVPLHMAFVLVPADRPGRQTQLKVDPFAAKQETAGVAPGNYEVSLSALGFKTEPANQPLSVQAGKIAEADFTLAPQGMVGGMIAAASGAGESYWGFVPSLPDGVRVRAIRLTGTGLSRELRPNDAMSERDVLKTFLASKDYAYKTLFTFFDVPAGEYTLAIDADGCEPYATKVRVTPGEFTLPPPFRLVTR